MPACIHSFCLCALLAGGWTASRWQRTHARRSPTARCGFCPRIRSASGSTGLRTSGAPPHSTCACVAHASVCCYSCLFQVCMCSADNTIHMRFGTFVRGLKMRLSLLASAFQRSRVLQLIPVHVMICSCACICTIVYGCMQILYTCNHLGSCLRMCTCIFDFLNPCFVTNTPYRDTKCTAKVFSGNYEDLVARK